jgi:hypothetical protein
MTEEQETCEYSDTDWEVDGVIAAAEEKGFKVIRSTSTTLLLDLDNGAAHDRYRKVFASLKKVFNLRQIDEWYSKSGVGRHVVLVCDELSFESRVALQAALGSDPVREGLAIARFRAGVDEPSLLFKPGAAARDI